MPLFRVVKEPILASPLAMRKMPQNLIVLFIFREDCYKNCFSITLFRYLSAGIGIKRVSDHEIRASAGRIVLHFFVDMSG